MFPAAIILGFLLLGWAEARSLTEDSVAAELNEDLAETRLFGSGSAESSEEKDSDSLFDLIQGMILGLLGINTPTTTTPTTTTTTTTTTADPSETTTRCGGLLGGGLLC